MFKKISVFLVLVLVIGALSACAGSGVGASSQPDSVEYAWAKKHYPIDWDAAYGESASIRYYGTFDGCDVFCLLSANVNEDYRGTIHIDDVDFRIYVDSTLGACQDGRYTLLSDLYKSSVISHDSLLKIAEAHEQGTTQKVSNSKKKEIEDAWYGRFSWKWAEEPNITGCRHYGKYDGYDVYFYQAEFPLQNITEYQIAGEKFVNGSDFQLIAYQDGIIYKLEQIFKDGEVSKDSVYAMAKLHKEWFPAYYSNEV